MNPNTQQLHDLGQSLWLDNITREILDDGTLAPLHRRAVGHRADLEPDDLRQGDRQRRRSTTTRSPSWRAQGSRAKTLFFELALEDLRAGRRPVPPGPRRDRRRRRLGVARGVAAARRRHRRHDRRRRRTCTRQAARPEPLHQDSGHAGGRAGDRGVDLRRRAGQRDAAVLARAVPRRRPRPTCAASSGASRPGSTRRSRRSPRCSSAAGTWR